MRNSGGWKVAALCLWCGATAWAEPKFSVTARGGVGHFTGELTQYMEPGPAWGLGLGVQLSRVLALELAYEGSSNELAGFTIPDSRTAPTITRHGGALTVRASPKFHPNIRPYVASGLGASYVMASQRAPLSFSDDVMAELPLMTGIDFLAGAVTAGLRGGFLVLFDYDFVRTESGETPKGARWDVNAALGGRF